MIKVYKKESPIKAPEFIKLCNTYYLNKWGNKFTEVRFRKFCNYVRTNSIVPLIATSNGYFVSHDHNEIDKFVLSMRQRANSINDCADRVKKFLK